MPYVVRRSDLWYLGPPLRGRIGLWVARKKDARWFEDPTEARRLAFEAKMRWPRLGFAIVEARRPATDGQERKPNGACAKPAHRSLCPPSRQRHRKALLEGR